MLDVRQEGNHALIDLRPLILSGKHPRNLVFDYIKKAKAGMIIEIHTPHLTKPLIDGIENMNHRVIVDELEPNHFRIITTIMSQ